MMKTPELKTVRLTLVPYTQSNITHTHVDWLNDPGVVKYSEQRHVDHTIHTQGIYVGFANLNGHIWLIRVNGVDIGSISVKVDKNNNVGNVGILIGERSMWGKGYGTEAWREVMDWCFGVLGLRKIECGCMSPNLGMRQVATNAGMRVEGGRPDHFLLDGKSVDLLYYGKMKS